MKNIFILILILSLSACMTEKKAERRITYLSVRYPSVPAKLCANYIKESHTSTIEYRQGKRDTLWQAEYIDCDTVIGTDRIVKVPYPVYKAIHDTLIFRDSVFLENTKKTDVIYTQLEKTNAQLISTNATLKSTRGLCAVLILILVAFGVFSYLKSKIPWTK